MNTPKNRTLALACFVIFLGIALGAFGAHGLEKIASPQSLKTFQTGVTYHLFHGLALLIMGVLQITFPHPIFLKSSKKFLYLLILGILLFSGNCYLYALTQIKFFAYLVPLGGLSFLLGWLLLGITLWRLSPHLNSCKTNEYG